MDTYKATMFPLYLSAVILLWIGITDFIHTSHIAKDSEKFIKKSGQKFPRITFSCIACMYLYLLATALRFFLFYDRFQYNIEHTLYFAGTFIYIGILSACNMITLQLLCERNMIESLKKSWVALKLAFIPFVPINIWLYQHIHKSIFSLEVSDSLTMIAWYLFFPWLLITTPIVLSFLLHIVHGCIGINYVRCIKRHTEDKQKPSGFHFVMQMIPILDLISMSILLIKYRNIDLSVKTPEPVVIKAKPAYVSENTAITKPSLYEKLHKKRKLIFLIYLLFTLLLYFRSELSAIYTAINA